MLKQNHPNDKHWQWRQIKINTISIAFNRNQSCKQKMLCAPWNFVRWWYMRIHLFNKHLISFSVFVSFFFTDCRTTCQNGKSIFANRHRTKEIHNPQVQSVQYPVFSLFFGPREEFKFNFWNDKHKKIEREKKFLKKVDTMFLLVFAFAAVDRIESVAPNVDCDDERLFVWAIYWYCRFVCSSFIRE